VPTPWLCLQEDLGQAGVDPARLDRIADRSMAENLNASSEGRIEAAQFFEPVVEEALASERVTCGTPRARVAVPLTPLS
jgi:NitT/TauT family transport system substrate-binding protein